MQPPPDQLADLAHRYPEIPAATLAAAKTLLEAEGLRRPDEVDRGYWPTVCLAWSIGAEQSVEVEVTDENYEFHAGMDIRHFPHGSGTRVPADLLLLLPTT